MTSFPNPCETTYRPEIGETSGLTNPKEYHAGRIGQRTVEWTEPGLKITRLRLLSDRGYPYWDVSYIDGVMPDGELVRVSNPFAELPKKGLMGAIIKQAQIDGVYAKGIGIFGAISTLN